MSGEVKGVNTEKHIQKVFNMKSIEKLWFKLQKVSMVKWGCQAGVNLVGDVMKTSESNTISILWSFSKLSMIYSPYFCNVMTIDFFANKMSSYRESDDSCHIDLKIVSADVPFKSNDNITQWYHRNHRLPVHIFSLDFSFKSI